LGLYNVPDNIATVILWPQAKLQHNNKLMAVQGPCTSGLDKEIQNANI
jgi:hypothetical protein